MRKHELFNLVIAILPHLFIFLFLFPVTIYQCLNYFSLPLNNVAKIVASIVLAIICELVIFKIARQIFCPQFVGDAKQFQNITTKEEAEEMLFKGDRLADAIMADLDLSTVQFPNFYPAILKSSKEARELEKEMKQIPSWLDRKKIADAEKFYRDNISLIFNGLSMGLVKSYTFPADAKILKISGGLVGVDVSIKRLNRTTQFVWDIVSSGGPYFGTRAFEQIFNVRMIHAHARKQVISSGKWDEPHVPINKITEAATLHFFCQVPIEYMVSRGIYVSEYEKSCCWELWRYVGFLMGIDERVLYSSYNEALFNQQQQMILQFQIPNEISTQLTNFTVQALKKDEKIPFSATLFNVGLRMCLGDKIHAKIEQPKVTVLAEAQYHIFSMWLSFVRVLDLTLPFFLEWKNYFFFRYLYRSGLLK